MNNGLIIWDVESYLYKACTACKSVKQLDEDTYIECYDIRNGIDYILDNANRLRNKLHIEDIICVVGDKENWRKHINPKYKSNRPKEKPVMYKLLKDELEMYFPVNYLPNLEGDDTARIMFEDNKTYPQTKVIVSVDKDFYSVPCTFLRDLSDDAEVEVVTAEQAQLHLCKQIIMGDTCDGYSGIPGMGEVHTNEFLEKNPTLADVLALYLEKGLKAEDYAINKAMASIVSLKEYDMITGKVKLL